MVMWIRIHLTGKIKLQKEKFKTFYRRMGENSNSSKLFSQKKKIQITSTLPDHLFTCPLPLYVPEFLT